MAFTQRIIVFSLIILSVPLHAANLRDLFDSPRLTKRLKATPDQQALIQTQVAELRRLVGDYQRERAKRTCEAILWQGYPPSVKALRTLR